MDYFMSVTSNLTRYYFQTSNPISYLSKLLCVTISVIFLSTDIYFSFLLASRSVTSITCAEED